MASNGKKRIDAEYAEEEYSNYGFFEKLFESGLFSDCVIRCKGVEWNLHRAILASRSAFFAARFKIRVEGFQSNVVELDDDDPSGIQLLLRHLYAKMDVDDIKGHARSANGEGLRAVIHLAAVAEKYGLFELANEVASLVTEKAMPNSSPGKCEVRFRMFLAAFEVEEEETPALEDARLEISGTVANAYREPEKWRPWINELLGQNAEFRRRVLDVLAS